MIGLKSLWHWHRHPSLATSSFSCFHQLHKSRGYHHPGWPRLAKVFEIQDLTKSNLSHSLADVFEEPMPWMLLRVGLYRSLRGQIPHLGHVSISKTFLDGTDLDIAIGRSSDKHSLIAVHSNTFHLQCNHDSLLGVSQTKVHMHTETQRVSQREIQNGWIIQSTDIRSTILAMATACSWALNVWSSLPCLKSQRHTYRHKTENGCIQRQYWSWGSWSYGHCPLK